jgi:hypothetical protein
MVDRDAPSHVSMHAGAGLDTFAGPAFVRERLAAGQDLLPARVRFLRRHQQHDPRRRRPCDLPALVNQANIWHFASASAIELPAPWTHSRAESWWSLHAPQQSSSRPVAEVLLSQEARSVASSVRRAAERNPSYRRPRDCVPR